MATFDSVKIRITVWNERITRNENRHKHLNRNLLANIRTTLFLVSRVHKGGKTTENFDLSTGYLKKKVYNFERLFWPKYFLISKTLG